MSEFMELEPCPDCESEIEVLFSDNDVCLHCTGCGRKYGVGIAAPEARSMCTWWNLLLRGDPDA
jgi:hypothetical protein